MEKDWAEKAVEEIMREPLIQRSMPSVMRNPDGSPLHDYREEFRKHAVEIIKRHLDEAFGAEIKALEERKDELLRRKLARYKGGTSQ